ncbi:hypothetical protein C8F04DRAFT_225083 [Mycena alexandri]|uniref:Uncharacterized protein n=1 Tax=Mycena alexandri TaxID=1745969 RepID=A0AAD6T7W4_9AGAR|nr:hypothetical protein C8F04DRAFT_225083 [Mycena alexandri]
MSFCVSTHVERMTEPSCVAVEVRCDAAGPAERRRRGVGRRASIGGEFDANVVPACRDGTVVQRDADAAEEGAAGRNGRFAVSPTSWALGMVVVAFVANSNFSLLILPRTGLGAKRAACHVYIPREFCRQRRLGTITGGLTERRKARCWAFEQFIQDSSLRYRTKREPARCALTVGNLNKFELRLVRLVVRHPGLLSGRLYLTGGGSIISNRYRTVAAKTSGCWLNSGVVVEDISGMSQKGVIFTVTPV